MTNLTDSRWAPGGSYDGKHNSQGQNNSGTINGSFMRRPRSENQIRTTPTNNINSTTGLLPPSEELARFEKIVARLKWKLPFLAEGYRLAKMAVGSGSELEEMMFKIDFYEYYALLERAIVHLLAVFNITVSSSAHQSSSTGVRVIGAAMPRPPPPTGHRYHANVLQALEDESSPLTPVLGSGHVFELLRQAKDLRNRWKTADLSREERERDPFERREVPDLAAFDFDEILGGIFHGLDEGYARARYHADLCRKPGDTADEGGVGDGGWGFIVDAMDWEAV
ncbi:hypothetical protein N7495_004786 [Penicillium taxi]|uniref:uncharacterized protein n=1 Tax=Penicillium taxi TaxID=168475 RepID=UPI0025459399|nr:uncharacterized protein N7495_004786 [Penicillium taxi]KAJ5900042.1 hypothetical protein N7495_004786 [Penicillium taxi]